MFRLLMTVGLLLAFPSAAQTRWGLKWVAPQECLGPADLAELVEQKLGRPVFGADAQFRIEGRVQRGAAPLWRARITVVSSAGEVMGSRELESDAADCRQLDGRIVLVVATSIDPTAPPPPAERRPAVSEKDEATESAEGSVFLHIDTPSKEVRLQRYLGTSSGTGYGSGGAVTVTTYHFSDECRAPCDRVIPASEQRFYIGGDGVSMAGPIVLADHQRAGRVNMVVKPGSAGALFMGWFTAGFFGLGGMGAGVAMMVHGASQSYDYRDNRGDVFMAAGVITLLAGAAVATTGVIVGVNNNTQVSYPDEPH